MCVRRARGKQNNPPLLRLRHLNERLAEPLLKVEKSVKSRYSEEQIIELLKQVDAGMSIKELEGESVKLKRLLADAHLDIHALKTVFGVKR